MNRRKHGLGQSKEFLSQWQGRSLASQTKTNFTIESNCFNISPAGPFQMLLFFTSNSLSHLLIHQFSHPCRFGRTNLFDYFIHLIAERTNLLVPQRQHFTSCNDNVKENRSVSTRNFRKSSHRTLASDLLSK